MINSLDLFFSNNSSSVQVAIFAILLSSIWTVELIFSIDSLRSKWKHSVINFLFIFSALPIQLFLTYFVVAISAWASVHHWGLLYLINFHGFTGFYYLVSFLLLDLFEYIYHVIMHKTGFLWKFHLVHHSDMELDVSTTVREHPGETFVRVCFLMFWVFISGASLGVLIIRQTMQTITNVLGHSKIRFPDRVNKVLSMVFITPNLHHVHHHHQLPYTDSNYGDVLSIWDRIFGTFKELSVDDTVFGLDTHFDKASTGTYLKVLKIPFLKNTTDAPGQSVPKLTVISDNKNLRVS